jgi:acetyl esterase/lipase
LDLFPAKDPTAPCLVFIHGGYWQNNSREGFACVIEGALAKGWSAALPGYTLCPHTTLTGIVAEIDQGLTWLAEHGPAHGIAGPIIVSGWSAGGHLAAEALAHPAVKAGLAISGIYELAPLRDTYLNTALQLTDSELQTLSPIRQTPSRKTLAIAYGTGELPEMHRQSRDFHAMRAAAHCPGWLIPISGANHFLTLHPLQDPSGELMKVAEALFTS